MLQHNIFHITCYKHNMLLISQACCNRKLKNEVNKNRATVNKTLEKNPAPV